MTRKQRIGCINILLALVLGWVVLIKFKSFEEMVAVIGQYGSHFPIPTYHDIRVPLLKELEYIQDLMKSHKEQRIKYSCFIMFNAWTDQK